MEANDFDTIFNKTFHQLTDTEKLEMEDLFTTEEEFLNMKFMLEAIHSNLNQQNENIAPNPKLKSNLDHLFHQTYQNKGVLWYNAIPTFFIAREKKWHQQNLIRIAAVLAVLVITIPFWKTDLKSDEALLSKVEQVQDEQKNKSKSNLNDTKKSPDKIILNSNSIASKNDLKDKYSTHPESKVYNYSDIEELKSEDFRESNSEDIKITEPSIVMAGASFKDHPDGIFVEAKNDKTINNVFTLAGKTNYLDLLTPTF